MPDDRSQPEPQWSEVDPHHPYCEQQFPNGELAQVAPPWEPHLPSVDTGLDGVLPPPLQVPNDELQPVPQWSVEDPHQPYCEQQLPKGELAQVLPPEPPQDPSVETLLPGLGEGLGLEPLSVEERYQLASGSPMHSPMVTPR